MSNNLKHHPISKKKEKSAFFLRLLLGEKTVAFVLTEISQIEGRLSPVFLPCCG